MGASVRLTLSLLVACIVPAAFANFSRAANEPNHPSHQIVAFAKQVERYGAEQGAQAFFISRQGRPQAELPPGVEFTHTGLAIYTTIPLADGKVVRGYVIHNLYQREDKPNRSHLVRDFPADFFSNVVTLKAGIIIPTPQLQQQLRSAIHQNTLETLHVPAYSAISNPFNRRRQNCNEWLLDVIQSVLHNTNDPDVIKRSLRKDFQAHPIKVNPFRLFAGALFMSDVTLVDQRINRVQTATFGALASYLTKAGLARPAIVLEPQ